MCYIMEYIREIFKYNFIPNTKKIEKMKQKEQGYLTLNLISN
jgi:hypothetical protein